MAYPKALSNQQLWAPCWILKTGNQFVFGTSGKVCIILAELNTIVRLLDAVPVLKIHSFRYWPGN